jgi:OmcA/MtrC family decaheme c-type cytochrome
VEFPGDLRNCDKCHVNDSQQLPLPAGLLPTLTPAQWWDPTMPMAAACLSCHDGDDAAAHAYANTTFFGESCATCHGEGKAFAVDKVHAH